jgi:hypothetical protein
MMKKVCFSAGLFFLIPAALAASAFAAEVGRITLSELQQKSDLIVMAEVMQVVEKGDRDQITIKAESYLKGGGPEADYTFTLEPRGDDEKALDPSLKAGDTGVFFLKHKSRAGQAEKAWQGSVALFVKDNFDLTEEKVGGEAARALADWRFYRVKLGQARSVAEYESGFLQGFSGPPGLPRGSADFKLGHSDGGLARDGIVPDWPDKPDKQGASN